MKYWLKIWCVLAVCLMPFLFLKTGASVQAAPPETGTLKITLPKEGIVELELFRVGSYENGEYKLIPEFESFNQSMAEESRIHLNHIKTAAELERSGKMIFQWIQDVGMQPLFREIIRDDRNCGEFPVGMYLLVQVPRDTDVIRISPFLLGIPYWEIEIEEDGGKTKTLIYDVNSHPKLAGSTEIDQEKPKDEEHPGDKEKPKDEEHPGDKEKPRNPEKRPSVTTSDGNTGSIVSNLFLLAAATVILSVMKKEKYLNRK